MKLVGTNKYHIDIGSVHSVGSKVPQAKVDRIVLQEDACYNC